MEKTEVPRWFHNAFVWGTPVVLTLVLVLAEMGAYHDREGRKTLGMVLLVVAQWTVMLCTTPVSNQEKPK